MDEIMIREATVRALAPALTELTQALRRAGEDMERMAATQQMMSERISDLERQLRLKLTLTKAQESRLSEAIRLRAHELLTARGVDDRRALTKLSALIRKGVTGRYGVRTLREAPAYDYETAMEQVRRWNDAPAVMAVVREARNGAHDVHGAGRGENAEHLGKVGILQDQHRQAAGQADGRPLADSLGGDRPAAGGELFRR